MTSTYLTMYENEVRAVEISIWDQNDSEWEPSSATYTIVDSDRRVIVNESPAMTRGNSIYCLVDNNVTRTPGEYDIRWKIIKTTVDNTYTFYHKTKLVVEEL